MQKRIRPQSGALPPVTQLSDVSPKTRLLEKRRLMYENQEQFQTKKKEAFSAEIAFRSKEKDLRDKDFEIQEQIIKFSAYLDLNQKTMAKCDVQMKQLDKDISEKEQILEKTQFWLKVVKEKGKRVEKLKKTSSQYESFLERVREANLDEYPDIKRILQRYETLEDNQIRLKKEQLIREQELKQKQASINAYEQKTLSKITVLTNDIGLRMKEQEEVMRQIANIKIKETAQSSAQLMKVKKLSKVVMAISSLEKACLERKKNIMGLSDAQTKSMMTYTSKNFFNPDNELRQAPINFDNYDEGFNYSMLQLDVIAQYLGDFKDLREEVQRKKQEDAKYSKEETQVV